MKTVFVFSGQGAQQVGMGKDLFEGVSSARAIFEAADKVLGWSVSELCFSGPVEKLTESRYCQPAIYTMSCACAAGLREKRPDIVPLATGGLSLGEYAALQNAGVFSFEDGVKIVARRGELMDDVCTRTKGAMASVIGVEPDVVRDVCAACGADVANYNCPGQIVISGTVENVAKAVETFKGKGFRKVIPLKVAGAYHSSLMKEAGDLLAPVLDGVQMEKPQFPVFQNFTGSYTDDVCEIRRNLVSQVAGSVRWEESFKELLKTGADTVIELGPGNVLTGLAKRMSEGVRLLNLNSMETLGAIPE